MVKEAEVRVEVVTLFELTRGFVLLLRRRAVVGRIGLKARSRRLAHASELLLETVAGFHFIASV